MKKNSQLQIRINDQKLLSLKEKAFEDYTNASEVINMMIDLYLSGQIKFDKSSLRIVEKEDNK